MKKLIIVLGVLFTSLLLVGCGNEEEVGIDLADYEKDLKLPIQENYIAMTAGVGLTDYRKGLQLMNEKKYDEAIKMFDKYLAKDGEHLDSFARKALILYEQGKYEDVIEINNKVLEFQPENYKVYYNKAFMYVLLEEYDKAIDNLAKSINIEADMKVLLKTDKGFDPVRKMEGYDLLFEEVE